MSFISKIKFGDTTYDLQDIYSRELITEVQQNTYTKNEINSNFVQTQTLEEYIKTTEVESKIETAKTILVNRISTLETAVGVLNDYEEQESILDFLKTLKEEIINPNSEDGLSVVSFLDKINSLCNGFDPEDQSIKTYIDNEVQSLNNIITSSIESRLAELENNTILSDAKDYTDQQIAAAKKDVVIHEPNYVLEEQDGENILNLSPSSLQLTVFK